MHVTLGGYEFSIKELSGAVGDFGTLLPLAVGFMVVNNMHPARFMVVFGITNVATGLFYKAPMPLQPMKAVAAIAISNQWSGDLLTATALSMGVFWMLMGLSTRIEEFITRTPESIIRGIQLSVGLSLGWLGITMIIENVWWLGVATIGLVLFMQRYYERNPSALLVVAVGVLISVVRGGIGWPSVELLLPSINWPDATLAWEGFIKAGIGQIPLTLTNAVIACAALFREYFPERDISEQQLMLNMGIMNIASSCLGGFPMCHGSGGLASHYYFGARTGGANIMEGALEVFVGVFFGSALLSVFESFPLALLGGMLIMVGVELGKFSRGLTRKELPTATITALFGTIFNLGVGFAAGLILTAILKTKHRITNA